MKKELRSALTVIIFLFCIYLLSFFGSNVVSTIQSINSFSFLLILSVLIQIIFFIPSFILKTEKLYDLIGSTTYIIITSIAYLSVENKTTTDTILFLFVIIWGIRLGTYLFKRIQRDREDVRFEKAKRNFFWFLQYWMGQALWVSITSCAAVIAILKPENNFLTIYGYIGIMIWILGFTLEVFADQQKNSFKKNQNTNKKFISTGLWSRSRHPNYLGEIGFWFGIYFMGVSSGFAPFWIIICPLLMLALFVFVSCPMMDQRSLKNRSDYKDYMEKTSQLFLLPPKNLI